MDKKKSPLDQIVEYAANELKLYHTDEHKGEETSCYDAVSMVLALAGTPEAIDSLYAALIDDKYYECQCLLKAFIEAGETIRDYLIQRLNADDTPEDDRAQILYALHACWEDDITIKAIMPYQSSDNPCIKGAATGSHDPIW